MTCVIYVGTTISMEIDYDPNKDALNMAAHDGISLELARHLDWDTLIAKADTRKDYGEHRMIGYAPLGERLYCIVFTDRGAGETTVRRIISLRKANVREVTHYGK